MKGVVIMKVVLIALTGIDEVLNISLKPALSGAPYPTLTLDLNESHPFPVTGCRGGVSSLPAVPSVSHAQKS